ncbi:MAG: AAA family ATPase [Bacteroidales bacterium]|nr:AAA family ATPase [Bacteroidales bacterium]
MEALFERQKRLLQLTPTEIVRPLMQTINWNRQLISIRGSRGVGKSTLMKQYVKLNYGLDSQEVLYCLLDNVYFTQHSILELAERFSMMGGKHLLLDEVHKYLGWSREIKEIYDNYPLLKVTISGSSLLNILNADADLSRRCRPYHMPGLSFREYLKFYHDLDFPSYTLSDIVDHPSEICAAVIEKIPPVKLFKEYLEVGYYPFFDGNKEDYKILLENSVNYILEQELPALRSVEIAYVRKIKALLRHCALSGPYEVDITKLSRALEISRNTVLTYLEYLSEAELLNLLYCDANSMKKMQKPDKIFLQNPNLLFIYSQLSKDNVGTLGETFAVNQLSRNHTVEYSKVKGDFLVDGKYLFEVGGEDKGFDQIADIPNSFVLADDREWAVGHKLPLWLIGLESDC